MPGHVFVSYGRFDASAFVEQLRGVLTAAGFSPYIDVDRLPVGEAWDEGLAEAIDTAEAMIVVLSPYGVRRAGDPGFLVGSDSVCLDEIVRARAAKRHLIPVMIERCDVPLPIARLNYIDMVGWQTNAAVLARGNDAVIAALREHRPILEAGPAPWDSSGLLAARAQGFVGRDWLFDQIEEWVAGRDGAALLLLGPPGVGKSAFAAELIRRDGGRRVVAHHLFQSETPATRDAGRFVRSLSAQLARTVPGYAAAIRAPETSRLLYPGESDGDPASALEGAVLAPLSALRDPGGRRMIILDALDEALSTGMGRQGLSVPELLAPRLDRFPPWLRIIATARPDPAAIRGFAAARRIRLDEIDSRNRADLSAWLALRLPPDVAERLARLAEGSFLYARLAAEALGQADRTFDLAGLPPRLTGLFSQFFGRSFPSEAIYAPARRVLSVMLAAREPLDEPALAAVAGLGPAQARAVFDALAPYLDRGGDGLTLHHKALADWLTDAQGGDPLFLVDRSEGAGLLLEWCRAWDMKPAQPYRFRHFAAHLAEAGQVAALRSMLQDGRFHAARRDAGMEGGGIQADAFTLAADWGELAAALLATGDDEGAARLAVTQDAMQLDAVVAAISRAALPPARITRVVAAMQGKDAAGRSAQAAGLRLAARAGLAAPLLAAIRSNDRALVAVAVPEAYRLWRDHPEAGWAAFEAILGLIPNWVGFPRGAAVNVAAGLSFAILTRHPAEPATLRRLSAAWRQTVQGLQRGFVARLLGRRWARAGLRPLLRGLMLSQPTYQPFNYAEIRTTFARPPHSHDPALQVVACLAEPSRGTAPIAGVLLGQPAPVFDVHLMLAVERTLVRLGATDPADAMRTMARLMEDGPVWIRQSVLYSGFHVLNTATEPPDEWIEAYAAWAYATIGPGQATLQTETKTYQLVPHMAWPQVVFHRHARSAEGRFIADWLDQAAALGDVDFARRAIGAAEVLSFVYQLDALALDALRATLLRDDPALRDDLVRALANIRFNAGALVDGFLQQIGRKDLLARVAAMPPSLSSRDFPTWIDAFFNRLLMTSDPFRAEVVDIMRRTAGASSPGELLSLGVDWVVHLLEGGMDPGTSPGVGWPGPPGRRTPGGALSPGLRGETPP